MADDNKEPWKQDEDEEEEMDETASFHPFAPQHLLTYP
jgi:hypothetical protein